MYVVFGMQYVVEAHATAAEFVFEVYLAVCVAMAKLVFIYGQNILQLTCFCRFYVNCSIYLRTKMCMRDCMN